MGSIAPYNRSFGQIITTDAPNVSVDRGFIAHFKVAAADAVAAATEGVHTAVTCTTPAVIGTAVVKAASAPTDTLTISGTLALGAAVNVLFVSLTTAGDDALAVTKDDETKTINIALAKTTAAKNTATLIQAAIRGLSTVGGVATTAFTCAAGGNWDTAAVATGEADEVAFSGGVTAAADVVTTGITSPAVPRNITATAGGTGGDIGAIAVTITGTDYADQVITETLPAFTADTAGTKEGAKAFKTVTSISIPAHDGKGATTKIGWGNVLGLPYKLAHNTVLYKQTSLDNTVEGTEPTVTVSASSLANNTIKLNSSLNGKEVNAYLIV